jgi:hypothetical protein
MGENVYIRCLRSDNDTFTALQGLDVRVVGSVLFSDQGGDIGLDTTGTETDNDKTDNETREGSTRRNGRRSGGGSDDDKTNEVDHTKKENCSVFAKILISHNSSEDGSDIAPKLEEGGESGSGLLTLTKSTRLVSGICLIVTKRNEKKESELHKLLSIYLQLGGGSF